MTDPLTANDEWMLNHATVSPSCGAMRDRGRSGVSNVVMAAFFGMAIEGLVIDTDHWRHLYLIMAMIWGLAICGGAGGSRASRSSES